MRPFEALASQSTASEPLSLDAPDIQAAREQITRMADARRETEAEIAALSGAIYQLSEEGREDRDARLRSDAETILAGGELVAASALEQRLLNARHRLDAIRRAQTIALEGFEAVFGPRCSAILRSKQTEHRAIVRRIALALIELSEACESERALHRQLEQAGVRANPCLLPQVAISGHQVGAWQTRDTPAWYWLHQMQEMGLLALADLKLPTERGRG